MASFSIQTEAEEFIKSRVLPTIDTCFSIPLEQLGDFPNKTLSMKALDLFEYYLDLLPETGLPSSTDIDPSKIPRILPNLTMVEVYKAPYSFKYRLAGTDIVENWGFEPTGRFLEDILPSPDTDNSYVDRITTLVSKVPFYRYSRPDRSDRMGYKNIEYLHLPLSSDGENIDRILSFIGYHLP